MLYKWQLYALVVLAGLFSAGLSIWEGNAPEWTLLRNPGAVVAGLGVVVFMFDRWLWRFPVRVWRDLVSTPDIRGTWIADAKIVHLDPLRSDRSKGYMVIKQTHSHLALFLYWEGEVGKRAVSKMEASAPMSVQSGNCALAASYRALPQGTQKPFGLFFYYAPECADRLTMYYRTNDGQVGDIVLTGRKRSRGETYEQVDANYKKSLTLWTKCRFHLATS